MRECWESPKATILISTSNPHGCCRSKSARPILRSAGSRTTTLPRGKIHLEARWSLSFWFRMQNVRTPILLLTARDAPEDIIKGLDAGAEDYLTKPFDFEVLLARIRARTRTASGKNAAQMRFADLFLDIEKHEAVRDGQKLDLTRTEFSILECLIRAAGRVVTRSRIIELVWGDREVSENNLDVFMGYRRSKVDRPGLPRLVHTERGLGYTIREGAE